MSADCDQWLMEAMQLRPKSAFFIHRKTVKNRVEIVHLRDDVSL